MSAGRLVVLRPLGLGDFLTGVPAYRALARAFPHHHRILAAPAALADLVPLAEAFHELVPVEALAPLPTTLHGAAAGINLHGRGPQSHRVLLAAAPQQFVAFRHEAIPASRGGAEWRRDEHEVVRWCRLLEHAGMSADPSELGLRRPPAAGDRRHDVTIVHPGAKSGARRWPASRFAAVARSERDRGRRVLITGSAAERELALAVAHEAGLAPRDVLAGECSLLDLAGLVAAAGRLVSGDTGIAHLASAYETPSVVLFGPVPPAQWGPPPRPIHRVLWSGSEGEGEHVGDEPHAGLLRVRVVHVVAALRELEASTLVS